MDPAMKTAAGPNSKPTDDPVAHRGEVQVGRLESTSSLLVLGRALFEGSVRAAAVVGLLGGLAALNNPEFGIPSLLAALATIWVLTKRPVRVAATAMLAAPLPAFAYALVAKSRGSAIDFGSYTLFMRSFGRGFGREPMPVFGLWVFIFGVLMAGLSIGLAVSRELCSQRAFHSIRTSDVLRSIPRAIRSATAAGGIPLSKLGGIRPWLAIRTFGRSDFVKPGTTSVRSMPKRTSSARSASEKPQTANLLAE